MNSKSRVHRHVGIAICGVALTTATVLAQLMIGLKPGPWKMREGGVGDPRPESGPIVHVPFDDIQRGYHQISEEKFDLPMQLNADCDGKGKQFVALSMDVAGEPAVIRFDPLSKKPGGGFSGVTSGATKASIATTLKRVDIPDPVATCNKDLDTFVAGRQYGKAQQGWARRYDRALPVTMHLSCQSEDRKKFGGFIDPGDITEMSRTVDYPIWVQCGPAKVFQTTDGGGKPPVRGPGADTPVPAHPVVATLSLPDLVIRQAIEQDERTLRVQVVNVGALPAPPTTLQLFYHRSGHVVKKEFAVPALSVNQATWVVASVGSPLAAASEILLRVDDPPSVVEKDETNNGYRVK